MANIGAGETYVGYLVKKDKFEMVDSLLKSSQPDVESKISVYTKQFRYRYLSSNEMTYLPISGWLKGKFDRVLFTSETDIKFSERDKIYLIEENKVLLITKVSPMVQHGYFAINKKPPHVLELE